MPAPGLIETIKTKSHLPKFQHMCSFDQEGIYATAKWK